MEAYNKTSRNHTVGHFNVSYGINEEDGDE